MEALITYSALIGVIHGANPAMGWLLGVYYGLTHRGLKNLYVAETVVMGGHILSVVLILGPIYYLLQSLMLPTLVIAGGIIFYIAYRLARMGKHRNFGLNFGLKKLFALGFLLALLHASSLPLLSIFCFTQPSSLGLSGMITLFSAHSLGAILSIYGLSTLTYAAGISLLKRIWINFELIWLAALALIAASLILGAGQTI